MTFPEPSALLLLLALAACDRPSTDQQDLNSLDAELTNAAARDPAMGGVRGTDAYVVYVTARAGGGSDVDLVSNAGG
jgi:hypothetical protein